MNWDTANTVTIIAAFIGCLPGLLAFFKTYGRLTVLAQRVPDYEKKLAELSTYIAYDPMTEICNGSPREIIFTIEITNTFASPVYIHKVYLEDTALKKWPSKAKVYGGSSFQLETIKVNEPVKLDPNDTKVFEVYMEHTDEPINPKKVIAVDGKRKIWTGKIYH
jgi:hypothetical protein